MKIFKNLFLRLILPDSFWYWGLSFQVKMFLFKPILIMKTFTYFKNMVTNMCSYIYILNLLEFFMSYFLIISILNLLKYIKYPYFELFGGWSIYVLLYMKNRRNSAKICFKCKILVSNLLYLRSEIKLRPYIKDRVTRAEGCSPPFLWSCWIVKFSLKIPIRFPICDILLYRMWK